MSSFDSNPLHVRVARAVRSRIEEGRAPELGTAASMAGAYGVSRLTMLRALRHLRAEGLVEFCRGRGVRIAGARAGAAIARPARTGALERLVGALEHELELGTWRRGDRLPKTSHLADTFGASKNTVTCAIRSLASRGLVHKTGKAWHVGRRATGLPPRGPLFPLVVLLLGDHEDKWPSMFAARSVNRFAEAFGSEAETHGVQLQAVLERPDGSVGVLPSGRKAIAAVARSLGPRYLGTLMLPFRRPVEEVRDWLEFLAGLGKPVLRLTPPGLGYVWVDNPAIVACMFGQWGSLKHGGAVAVAWDILDSLGHRVVGMPSLIEEYDKLAEIMHDLFLRYAAATPERLHTAAHKQNFWVRPGGESRDEIINRLRTRGVPFIRELLSRRFSARDRRDLYRQLTDTERHLIADTALVAPLLADHGATALVGANDFVARRIYYWCRAAGIRLPREISLISFDNSVEIKPFPISSMDMGQKRLGFKAFHLLFGDIPVKTTNAYQLWGGTSLNHSGSLGPPGGRDLSRALRGEWR